MKKGGYKIIDLSSGTFTGSQQPVSVPGVYEAVESTNKRTVVSGLTIAGVELDDFGALFTINSSGNYEASVPYGLAKAVKLTIKDNDTVVAFIG